MSKSEFAELAANDHRGALLALYEMCTGLKAEQDATQATVLELATAVNAPASK